MTRIEKYLKDLSKDLYEGNEYGCIKGIILRKITKDILELHKQDMVDLLDDFVIELDKFSFDTDVYYNWVIDVQDLYTIQEQFIEKIGADVHE